MLVSKKCVGSIGIMGGLPAVLTDFARSLADMMSFNAQYLCGPDQFVHTIWSRHSFHTVARNEMVREALGEWVFLMDTDHQFGPDLLFRLYNAMRRFDADVVSALYLHKKGVKNPTLWKFAEDGTPLPLGDWPRGEVMEVDCAGAGALLIKNTVFDRIHDELGEEPFSIQEFKGVIGEDFAFFRRLKKLGIHTICPTYIECPHLAVEPLRMWEDYDPAQLGDRLGEAVTVKARKEAA